MAELACTRRTDGGKLCPNPPVPGDDKCADHKGKMGGKIQRRRQNFVEHYLGNGPIKDIEIVRQKNGMPHLGDPIEVDPGIALLQEIHRCAGHVVWLEAKVRSLEEDDLVFNKTLEVSEEVYGDEGRNYTLSRSERKAEISKWWDLYTQERKHLAVVSAAAIRAGIEERRVRLAERSVDALENAITAALQDLGVDPFTARARQAIGNRLREAMSGEAAALGYADTPAVLAPVQANSAPEVLDAEYWSQDAEEF